MRIVVVGGTGSVGTAVVDVAVAGGHEVVGVSRREPGAGPPYGGLEWHAVDIAARGAFQRLVAAFTGADAVVHAAWLLQPSRRRADLHRVNVLGSSVLFDAVAVAGVPQVVYLSSVGAYGPKGDDDPVDESWPVTGVSTSDYSRDKVDVEAMLDRFEAAHPDVVVTRLRPGLVLQRRSASELRRSFTGALAPAVLWRFARPRALAAGAWRARALPMAPSWVDVAMAVPIMSTDRAAADLGWRARWSATDTLGDLLSGLAAGAGVPASPALRPE